MNNSTPGTLSATCAIVLSCLLCLSTTLGAGQPAPVYPALEAKLLSDPKHVITEAEHLYQLALSTRNKTEQVASLHLLALAYLALEDDTELSRVANAGAELAKALTDNTYFSEFKQFKAIVLEKQGDLTGALELLNAAIALAELTDNEELIAQQYSARGRFHLYRENFDLALDDFLLAHETYEKYGDKDNLGMSFSNLATLYESTGEYEKAIELHLKSATYGNEEDTYDRVVIHLNLGSSYSGLGDFKKAEQELRKARALATRIQDVSSLAYSSFWIGEIRSKQKKYAEALSYYKEALNLFNRNPDAVMQFNCHIEIAVNSIPLYGYATARQHLARAAQFYTKLQNPSVQLDLLEAQAKYYQAMEDYKSTSEILSQRMELEEKLHDVKRERSLEKMKLRFHTAQKESENTILHQKNTVQALQLRKNQVEQRYQMMAIALVIALLLFTYLAYLRQKKLRKQMATLALTDELTGLPNRRHILDIAQQELVRSIRYHIPLSLAVIDLDYFKQINDRFGHDTGDRVLRQFTGICTDIIRKNDVLGRMGGEEWLGIFPHTQPEELILILERIRKGYANARISSVSSGVNLTFSAGITLVTTKDVDLDSVLKRADRAMYQAKADGRDRFVLDTSLPPDTQSQSIKP